MATIELGNPELLLLLPFFVVLTLLGHYFAQRIKRSLEVFHFPPVQRLSRIVAKKGVSRSKWRGVGLALKLVVIILITFSLANPVLFTLSEISDKVEVPMTTQADIAGRVVLVVDNTPSMLIRDVEPSRLEAAKSILTEFVRNASDDVRFGIVTFDREIGNSFPLTSDKGSIISILQGMTTTEGLPCLEELTDIGYGLQTGLNILAEDQTVSNRTSAIILVSDGYANYGYPSPVQSVAQATARASELKVPVYTLELARGGQDSNDVLMRRIADDTHGKFTNPGTVGQLREVLDLIGKYYVPTHEWKSEVEIKTTIPSKTALGFLLMFVASLFILALWIGNYRHYKTSF